MPIVHSEIASAPIPMVMAICLVLLAAGTALREQIVLSKRSSRTWEELVASLHPVRTEALIRAASAISTKTGKQTSADFSELFSEIGGPEGLRRIQFNTGVLMALAAYTEMWSLEDSRDAIELIQHDGLRLRRLVIKFSILRRVSARVDLASHCIYETAKLYCGMVERLLALCEAVRAARYPALVAAVNW